MRRFRVVRDVDPTGMSGTGHICDGVLFDSGFCALAWLGERPSYVIWPRLEDAEFIHGHGGTGQTRIEWIDPDVEAIEQQHVWRGEDNVTHRPRRVVDYGVDPHRFGWTMPDGSIEYDDVKGEA